MGRRRNSGHSNKLYEDSAIWGILVVVIVIIAAIALVVLLIWTNADGSAR